MSKIPCSSPGPGTGFGVTTALASRDRCGGARRVLSLAGLGAIAMLAACAGTPPTEALAVSEAAVQRVSSPLAAQAPDDVARAQDKLAAARQALAEQRYDDARRWALEAQADAELAESRAAARRSGDALSQVQQGLQALRAELEPTRTVNP